MTKELIKLTVNHHSLQSMFNKINQEKINNLAKKLIELQDKGESTISDQEKEYIKETKATLIGLKNFIISDISKREQFIINILKKNNHN